MFEACRSWELGVSTSLGAGEVLFSCRAGCPPDSSGRPRADTLDCVLFAWVWNLSAPLSAARELRARKTFLQKAEWGSRWQARE